MVKESRTRLNFILTGDPALWLAEWKDRGLVKSNSDAVRQAFRLFHEKLTETDLKSMQSDDYLRGTVVLMQERNNRGNQS